MAADVVVVGSYIQDNAWLLDRFPRVGETCIANGVNVGPGGKGFNQAVACARQGPRTTFIGAIGDDEPGRIAQRFAADEGLECRWKTCTDAPTASASIVVAGDGATFGIIHLAANERLDAAFLHAHEDAFTGARAVLLQMESPPEAVAAAIALGRRHGLLRVLNPAPMRRDFDLALLADCDVLTPNETEFALLVEHAAAETPDPATLGTLDDATLHALARRTGLGTLVITLGAQGCFVSHAEPALWNDTQPFYRVAPERVQAVDTTGAGDAFSGSLVAALVRLADRPLREAVQHANRSAALSTETIGTAPAMPHRAQVTARFGDADG